MNSSYGAVAENETSVHRFASETLLLSVGGKKTLDLTRFRVACSKTCSIVDYFIWLIDSAPTSSLCCSFLHRIGTRDPALLPAAATTATSSMCAHTMDVCTAPVTAVVICHCRANHRRLLVGEDRLSPHAVRCFFASPLA